MEETSPNEVDIIILSAISEKQIAAIKSEYFLSFVNSEMVGRMKEIEKLSLYVYDVTNHNNCNLVIFGNNGVGKTYLIQRVINSGLFSAQNILYLDLETISTRHIKKQIKYTLSLSGKPTIIFDGWEKLKSRFYFWSTVIQPLLINNTARIIVTSTDVCVTKKLFTIDRYTIETIEINPLSENDIADLLRNRITEALPSFVECSQLVLRYVSRMCIEKGNGNLHYAFQLLLDSIIYALRSQQKLTKNIVDHTMNQSLDGEFSAIAKLKWHDGHIVALFHALTNINGFVTFPNLYKFYQTFTEAHYPMLRVHDRSWIYRKLQYLQMVKIVTFGKQKLHNVTTISVNYPKKLAFYIKQKTEMINNG